MKLRITESQLERLKNKITEEVSPNSYSRVIKPSFNTYELKIDGHDVEAIDCGDIRLSFEIGLESRSWGIKGIDLGNIQGPSEVEAEITYYVTDEEGDYVTQEKSVVIYFDWSTANVEYSDKSGVITIDDDVEISLRNAENGNYIATEINITAYIL
ncbi:MAG: hypothetical protein E6R13_02805 [Spirochaetes bacterium]|nr:MAG: hypothetical protein E6R13_02805 [Spirochaetota bacterium]